MPTGRGKIKPVQIIRGKGRPKAWPEAACSYLLTRHTLKSCPVSAPASPPAWTDGTSLSRRLLGFSALPSIKALIESRCQT